MALVDIELVTHASEPDALTTRPPPCGKLVNLIFKLQSRIFPQYLNVSCISCAFLYLWVVCACFLVRAGCGNSVQFGCAAISVVTSICN